MANHKKALTHHLLAGKALRAGDSKTAAHHLGHAMNALRSTATSTDPVMPPDDPSAAPEQEGGEAMDADAPPKSSLFFGQFAKSPSSKPSAPASASSGKSEPGGSGSKGKLAGLLKALKR